MGISRKAQRQVDNEDEISSDFYRIIEDSTSFRWVDIAASSEEEAIQMAREQDYWNYSDEDDYEFSLIEKIEEADKL